MIRQCKISIIALILVIIISIMKVAYVIIAVICLVGAPLTGILIKGEQVSQYLYFPPESLCLTIDHAPFSWPAFFIILALVILVMAPFLAKVLSSLKNTPGKVHSGATFPWWGWIGGIIMTAGWILAWSRFTWFSPLQTHTFSIPWIGFIVLVNALTFMRCGRCMITHQKKYILLLFLFSAVFWWYFEYLNQFVENWYYVNVENLNRFEFFLYATLPFATVLPAVTGTRDLLLTFPGLSGGLDRYFAIPLRNPHRTALVSGLAATLALALTPLWPDYLFPMLWLAPLVIIAAIVTAINPDNPAIRDVAGGNLRNIYLLALAALICGFFWEMWNFYSYTRWEYSVPFVNRFHIFEMPVLGYAGYLPFGLQCGLAAWIVQQMTGKGSK
jgi:hypothetical protein